MQAQRSTPTPCAGQQLKGALTDVLCAADVPPRKVAVAHINDEHLVTVLPAGAGQQAGRRRASIETGRARKATPCGGGGAPQVGGQAVAAGCAAARSAALPSKVWAGFQGATASLSWAACQAPVPTLPPSPSCAALLTRAALPSLVPELAATRRWPEKPLLPALAQTPLATLWQPNRSCGCHTSYNKHAPSALGRAVGG